MSSIGELSVAVTCDPSELTEGMTEVRDEVEETESVFMAFGREVVEVMTRIGGVVKDTAVGIVSDMADVGRGALKQVAQDFLETAIDVATAGAAVTATGSYFIGFWNTLRIGLSAASWFVPWLKVVTIGLTAVSVASYAFQKADEYLNGELSEMFSTIGDSSKAMESFRSALGDVRELAGSVADGIGSIGAQAVKFGAEVTGVASAVRTADTVAAGSIDLVSNAIGTWAEVGQWFIDGLGDSASAAGATAEQLRKMAKATDDLIAKQTSHADIARQIRLIQEGAQEQSAHQAELQRIAGIETVDAINAETTALQQKSQAIILSGSVTEEELKKQSQLFLALENQRNAIASGKFKKTEKASEADAAIARARKDLDTLTIGRSEAEIAALKAAGATDEQLESLRALHAEIDGITRSKEIQKRIDSELENIAKQAVRDEERFAEQMAGLTDEIDLLTGAATKADIAVRKMLRDGFSQEQADIIGQMTAEKERLEEEERKSKDKSSASGKRLAAAAEAGSSAAFSIIANASVGRDAVADNTKKIASESVKQTGHLQKLVDEVGDFQNVSVVELPA